MLSKKKRRKKRRRIMVASYWNLWCEMNEKQKQQQNE